MRYDNKVKDKIVGKYLALRARNYTHSEAYLKVLGDGMYRGSVLALRAFIANNTVVEESKTRYSRLPSNVQTLASQLARNFAQGTAVVIKTKTPGARRWTTYAVTD